MGQPEEFGDNDPGSELRATFDDLWRRYHAQVAELKANQRQWRASLQHYQTTGSAWGLVLMNARSGLLDPAWRDTLSPDAHYAAGFPRPTDPALLDADALAIYEVATAPRSPWEPGAAGGNWRRWLTAWQLAANDLQRHQFRVKRWLSDMAIPAADRPNAARLDAVLEARALDAIEASYRAGLAAGGDAEDWRGWYRSRITETWFCPRRFEIQAVLLGTPHACGDRQRIAGYHGRADDPHSRAFTGVLAASARISNQVNGFTRCQRGEKGSRHEH
ncbi:hypothetical protein MSM1_07970 [Mycobacterium sp. SM1]|uniref:hypothetical protein n=1 Tax=Mycobacterium sp. SM1 TaxID=2816243 RepID=UPI001BD0165B|nr:hypothetical protein [Mycobacterium sp. SM1]MBS4728281.1 hypothetical protein [Mycobacterium sp. SM1]